VIGRWDGERIVPPEQDYGARPPVDPPPIKPRRQLYTVTARGGVRKVSEPSARGPQPVRRGEPSLARSSRTMAIASAVSRLTGFLRQIAITAAIGILAIGNAYNTANYLPNTIYELLIGGVLTSVVVPLLVHAQRHDGDDGEAYAQRLLSLTAVLVTIATVVAVVAAPLLIRLFGLSGHGEVRVGTILARLLLPEIIFYGIGALFGAILNTRGVFGPPMWTPVLNNLVVIATAVIFFVMPGPHTLTINNMTNSQIYLLGIGTTLGIIVQACGLWPYMRRIGFRWKWRFDLRGTGLKADSTLLLWVVGYVAVSLVGLVTITHLSNAAGTHPGVLGYGAYSNVSLVFQMPYGIVGVALLTALLPRMSRAAAAGNIRSLIDDLSLGSRLTAVALIPVTAAFIVLGPAIMVTIFAHGRTSVGSAHDTGIALAWAAFGLFPYAMTLLQLRAFYAVKDARTPTLINLGMVVVRVAMSLLVPVLLPDRHVVAGLAFVNSFSFLVGLFLGDVLLRRRFG
ncbi:MAG TPA: murein biosynthesis integral membrane protein MurJ, partial [Micromonosporaceae bacterium]